MKTTISRIKNLIRWFPVIWNDQDWDSEFTLDILLKKLEHQRDFFLSKDTHLANSWETADEIAIAISKLRHTRDYWEHYEQPAHEELDVKWGKGIMRTEKYGEHCHEILFDREFVKTTKDEAKYKKEFTDKLAKAREEYAKDKADAYLYLATNIDKWWD